MFPFLAQAEAIKYRSDIKPKYYNDVWERQFDVATRIDYDPEEKQFDFYIKGTLYLTGFSLTREQADSLIAAIEKYKEWNLKASKKGVTLEKEINKVMSSRTFWKIGNGDWKLGWGANLAIYFLSQSEQKHQLVIVFPKFKAKYNDYSTHRPETLYFNYDEAMRLKEALTEKAISIFIEKAKKQAEIEAEFN